MPLGTPTERTISRNPFAHHPGFFTGAVVGLLVAAAATGVAYFAAAAATLPFLPYDLFDWTTRRLPGAVVTAGIDAMVTVIRSLELGPTADIAKMAEQAMAIVLFLFGGALGGGLLFAALRRTETIAPRWIGFAWGIFAAVAFALMHMSIGRAGDARALISVPWITALLAAWGLAAGWIYERLTPVRMTADPSFDRLDRRRFLVRVAGATATITVIGAGLGRLVRSRDPRRSTLAHGGEPWSVTNALPNADAAVEPVRGTRPELTPVADHYRIDITTGPPVIDGGAWRLRIGGLVGSERVLTLADVRAYEPMHEFVTLECISNRVAGDLISTTRWTGVSLQRLLHDIGVDSSATHLIIRSADGFHECVALDLIRADARVMLCYEWDGLPLHTEHGYPLRLWIPDRYGMKQPKWIESIDAVDEWQAGYWVERGWDREAIIRATSVIDTIATDMMMPQMQGSTIPIGGIAFAGARGISRVQVRVDDGPWHDADLRDPLSDTTWVLWRYEWPFVAGEHTLAVRCFDREGVEQIAEPAPPHPSGATGIHRVQVML